MLKVPIVQYSVSLTLVNDGRRHLSGILKSILKSASKAREYIHIYTYICAHTLNWYQVSICNLFFFFNSPFSFLLMKFSTSSVLIRLK